ncbi:MAG: hypothetical protein ACKODX_13090 [Gemmata sp.]
MNVRRAAALAVLGLLLAGAAAPAADEPKMPDANAFDKLVTDTLRTVHNTGADLYNEGRDFAGAYRLYQGALLTARPLLAHRPEAQKLIDTGFAAADKEADVARKAFTLHVAIEAVRKNLKDGGKAATEPKGPKEAQPAKPEQPAKPSGLPVAPAPKEKKMR